MRAYAFVLSLIGRRHLAAISWEKSRGAILEGTQVHRGKEIGKRGEDGENYRNCIGNLR